MGLKESVKKAPRLSAIPPKKIVEGADEFAKSLKYVKTNQMRKIFSEIRKYEKKEKAETFFYLIPKIAYQVGRADKFKKDGETSQKDQIGEIMTLYKDCCKKMEPDVGGSEKNEIDALISIFESIIAYHAMYGKA